MKKICAVFVAFLMLGSTPAWADDIPEPQGDGTGGAFSPKFDNSPVNLVICIQPSSCRFDLPPVGKK